MTVSFAPRAIPTRRTVTPSLVHALIKRSFRNDRGIGDRSDLHRQTSREATPPTRAVRGGVRRDEAAQIEGATEEPEFVQADTQPPWEVVDFA